MIHTRQASPKRRRAIAAIRTDTGIAFVKAWERNDVRATHQLYVRGQRLESSI
ncbi:MAG: hypothetical protein K6T90_18440 [Leptolyngbyaceae cyanobacterium HOT.MB2.61]|nr:hypothetical protein [Leptolyngbyaceae cyanobacterium HOT.MB2.61]